MRWPLPTPCQNDRISAQRSWGPMGPRCCAGALGEIECIAKFLATDMTFPFLLVFPTCETGFPVSPIGGRGARSESRSGLRPRSPPLKQQSSSRPRASCPWLPTRAYCALPAKSSFSSPRYCDKFSSERRFLLSLEPCKSPGYPAFSTHRAAQIVTSPRYAGLHECESDPRSGAREGWQIRLFLPT